jgi:hypothetical protein
MREREDHRQTDYLSDCLGVSQFMTKLMKARQDPSPNVEELSAVTEQMEIEWFQIHRLGRRSRRMGAVDINAVLQAVS